MPISQEEVERLYGHSRSSPVQGDFGLGWGDRLEAAFNSALADSLRVGELAGLDVGVTRGRIEHKSNWVREQTSLELRVPESLAEISDFRDIGLLATARVVDATPYLLIGIMSALLLRWAMRRSGAPPAN